MRRLGARRPGPRDSDPAGDVGRHIHADRLVRGPALRVRYSSRGKGKRMPPAFVPYARHLARLVSNHEDGRAQGHSLRLEALVRAIVGALPPSLQLPDDADLWPWAMLPHDIGKLAVSPSILRKPGPLTPEEYGLLRIHAPLGREWLEQLAAETQARDAADARFWYLAARIAGGHHERPDGLGYPLGLKGDALPLVLRVARTADVYDALTARRSYREALPHRDALRMMRDEIGGFDEELLEALFILTEASDTVAAAIPGPQRGWE